MQIGGVLSPKSHSRNHEVGIEGFGAGGDHCERVFAGEEGDCGAGLGGGHGFGPFDGNARDRGLVHVDRGVVHFCEGGLGELV